MDKKLQGAHLENVIKALGYKKNKVSKDLRLSQSLISALCNGSKPIQDYQLLLLEKVYGVNSKYIEGNSDEMFISSGKKADTTDGEREISNLKTEISDSPDFLQSLKQHIADLREEKSTWKQRCEKLEARLEKQEKEYAQEKNRLLDIIEDLQKEITRLGEGKATA